jgi:hypothetical protein
MKTCLFSKGSGGEPAQLLEGAGWGDGRLEPSTRVHFFPDPSVGS